MLSHCAFSIFSTLFLNCVCVFSSFAFIQSFAATSLSLKWSSSVFPSNSSNISDIWRVIQFLRYIEEPSETPRVSRIIQRFPENELWFLEQCSFSPHPSLLHPTLRVYLSRWEDASWSYLLVKERVGCRWGTGMLLFIAGGSFTCVIQVCIHCPSSFLFLFH